MRARITVSLIFSGAVLAAAVGAPAALAHDGTGSVSGHMAEDDVALSPALEARLTAHTRAATAADAGAAAAAVVGNEHLVGQWGPLVDWPVVGVHVALLPNGKVLAYDSVGDNATETYAVHDHTRATVWDPETGTQTPVWVDTGYNIFCSGLAHLTDGSVFVAGGNLNAQLQGIPQTHLFRPATNSWSLGPTMAAGRWYPTVTPLRNGEMLITSGGPTVPEVRTTGGSLRSLTSASLSQPLYPWTDVAPNGRVFVSGPDSTLRSLDTAGTGAWQSLGQRDTINRDYGSHAFYDIGKELVAGGGPSSRDARVIDLNGATPQVTQTAPMANGRRQHNLTVLADGSVLATGGNSSGAALVDLQAGVYVAERWDPSTGTWSTLSAETATRQYHSTALLLPDGRVLSSGGGICGTCDTVGYLAKNAQVFTPPYLFNKDGSGALAPRPVVDTAPASTTYGASFDIGTAQAASIAKVALVRLGAVTHSVNMEQRYVPLSFTAAAGTLTATAPANANIAPPGVYMLFVVDSAGVPSVSRMVTLVTNSPPSVGLTQPAAGAAFTAPATIAIAADAADSDGTIAKVEFFSGATKLGEDAAAPFGYDWTNVPAGSYSISARATDDLGAQTTSAPRTVSVSAPTINQPPTAAITSPAAGATFKRRANVVISATAGDPDGRVTRVEFYTGDGAVLLGQDTTSPYSYNWKNAPSGSQVLRVKAYDNGGAVTTSAPVGITIAPK
jgi:hypothetical protein